MTSSSTALATLALTRAALRQGSFGENAAGPLKPPVSSAEMPLETTSVPPSVQVRWWSTIARASEKNMSQVKDEIYTGSDPVLCDAFATIREVRRLKVQTRGVLLAGKNVKGMVDEEQFEARLAENELTGKHDQILREQYHRRMEYFRTRMLIEHHLLPLLKLSCQKLIRLGGDLRAALRQGFPHPYSDCLYFLGEVVNVLDDGKAIELIGKARAFVREPDETRGKGQIAFERFWRGIPGFCGQSLLPAEFQVHQGVNQHPLDCELWHKIVELWKTIEAYKELIAETGRIHPVSFRRPKDSRPTKEELRRYPRSHNRLLSMAVVGGDEWTGTLYLGEKEATALRPHLAAVERAVATMDPGPSRWLAMSNYIGAQAILGFLRNCDASAHNLVLFDGGALRDCEKMIVCAFDGIVKESASDLA
ncbi:MAG TPA: hypothetical protein V6D17_04580 [Candidatus Obscuribacterales bacterium]